MAIKKVKLPNNTTEDINDPRLPAVTTTDNGKVLSVSGGIWSADSKPSYTLDEVSDGSTRSLANYQPIDADLTAIAGLSGTSGLLKKTAANTWSLDTNTYYYSGNANKSGVQWSCSALLSHGYNYQYLDDARYYTGTSGDKMIIRYLTSTGSAGLHFGAGTYTFLQTIIWGNFIQFKTYSGTAAVDVARLTKTGLGIMKSPSQALDVSGNIVASGTITPGSDSRIKGNQKDIPSENAFLVIEKLRPKTWVWNEKSNENLNGKNAAGLVAQEVKEILPDAVTISENGDIKDFHSLNYNTIQGYEIAAIKGLIEEVKSLKAEIVELKKQIK